MSHTLVRGVKSRGFRQEAAEDSFVRAAEREFLRLVRAQTGCSSGKARKYLDRWSFSLISWRYPTETGYAIACALCRGKNNRNVEMALKFNPPEKPILYTVCSNCKAQCTLDELEQRMTRLFQGNWRVGAGLKGEE